MFIPEHYAQQSQLFALIMFALPFVARPIGGYFVGKMADLTSLNNALDSTLHYASVASLLIAILPSYYHMGIFSTVMFIILRSLQGFALGGEYTTAGTLLIDQFSKNKYFLSGILGASGTIGSIIAFAFTILYTKFFSGTEIWRLFFVFGGVATYITYYLRKHQLPQVQKISLSQTSNSNVIELYSIYKTLAIGAVTSASCFVPMVYSNFYLTKVLGLSSDIGLTATLTSLVSYILFTPLVGYVSDYINIDRHLSKTFLVDIPFITLGFYLIKSGSLLGQLPLTIAASVVGANIHVTMNQLFPLSKRSRSINLYFATGASLGALIPALSGYINVHYDFSYTPFIAIIILLLINSFLFAKVSLPRSHMISPLQ
jgi:MHS family proline/betaine transporter-like MFS transporter